MKKIGFKNFRRFKDFSPIEYGGVTFLVGRNNAGKSTLVKALLLIDNYFKAKDIYHFHFDNNILEDVNVVTYGRALHHNSNENFIEFTFQFEKNLVQIKISGESEKCYGIVNELKVIDYTENLEFIFNIENKFITLNHFKKSDNKPVNDGNNKVHLENNDNVSSIIFSIHEDFGGSRTLTEIIDRLVSIATNRYDREFENLQNENKASDDFKDLKKFYEFDPDLVKITFQNFMDSMDGMSLDYPGLNAGKQSSLFNIRDKNNALAQAIHDFEQLNIQPGHEERLFVQKWMKEFEIGDDFTIKMHAGEAYEVTILSNDSDIQLADKGMGSIKVMLLILRIACVSKRLSSEIRRRHDFLDNDPHVGDYWPPTMGNIFDFSSTIIIEEPELNLHPALQSKLADLFLDAHQKFSIDFLIETHSEYILRRSQVIVAQKNQQKVPPDIPFCVHYFPKNIHQIPYRLEFKEDGSFNRNFGDGFFDEASSSTLELLKIKSQKNS